VANAGVIGDGVVSTIEGGAVVVVDVVDGVGYGVAAIGPLGVGSLVKASTSIDDASVGITVLVISIIDDGIGDGGAVASGGSVSAETELDVGTDDDTDGRDDDVGGYAGIDISS
jgi:hypothetical protein